MAGEPLPARDRTPADADAVDAVAKALRSGEPCGLFLGGTALREAGLVAASRVANATGAKLLAETFPARLERGAGIPGVDRLAYLAEFAAAQLDGLRHLVLVDAKAPVCFFAYPGKASDLVPDGLRGARARRPGRRRARRAGGAGRGLGAPADGAAASRRPGPTCPPAR